MREVAGVLNPSRDKNHLLKNKSNERVEKSFIINHS